MGAFLYVIIMAIAFTNMFNGALVPFYIKYFVAILFLLVWIFDFGVLKKSIPRVCKYTLRKVCYPYIAMAIWSCIVWLVDTPVVFNSAFVSRMLANVIYIIIAYSSAVAATYFFGTRAIKLSLVAMFLSVIVNLVYVISQYGTSIFLAYLPHLFSTTDYEWGSTLFNFSLALEVQDITMASGFYMIYLLFHATNENKRNKILYIILCLVTAIIGFKRTTFMGLAIVFIMWILIRKKNMSLINVIYLMSAIFIGVSFGYIILIDTGALADIVDYGIDVNGRIYIYNILSKYFSLSPFYLGKGFAYVDKIMYETTSFAAHSVIVRMFAEIGFIPFFMWMIHFMINLPKQITARFGGKYGYITYMQIIYMFTIFFMENTLTLFCIQFSFALMIASAAWESTYEDIEAYERE